MGTKENTLDTEESYLSPAHPELSLSSGVISLPSANKLADLSLASDLTDSEAENEPTVLTSRPCYDCGDGTNDISHNENKKMSSDTLKSNMLPNFQRSVNSLENTFRTGASTSSRCIEIPSSLSIERYRPESIIFNEEPSRDFCPAKNATQVEEIPSLPSPSLDVVRGTLQQHCNLLSDRHLLKDLFESLDGKVEEEPEPYVSVQSQCPGKESKTNSAHEEFIGSEVRESSNALGMLDKQFPAQPSTVCSLKCHRSEYASITNFDQGKYVLSKDESLRKSQLDHREAHTAFESSREDIFTSKFNLEPAQQEVAEISPSDRRHVRLQLPEGSSQDSFLNVEGKENEGNKELLNSQQSFKVLQ